MTRLPLFLVESYKERDKPMNKIKRFVIWICAKFTLEQIYLIIDELIELTNDKNSELLPKDDFKEKHPNYRDFSVDPLAPVDSVEIIKRTENIDYKNLLEKYLSENNKPVKPVLVRNPKNRVPEHTKCPYCSAPHEYIYYNDGKKRTQLKCKVCSGLFQLHKRFQNKTKHFCPYCYHSLYVWKQRKEVTIYKCHNDKCAHRIRELNKLNKAEKKLIKEKSSQFKINYQYREYHYKPGELKVAEPHKPKVNLHKIHHNKHIFSLILTLHISYAITARKTSHMLKNVWGINASHQTILNYSEVAAFYCHQFNMKNKGSIDDINAGDETYIKIKGVWNYIWFFMSTTSKKISGYHLADNRGTQPAIAVMQETVRTAQKNQKMKFITDGNPAYQAGLHFINQKSKNLNIELKNVIGLQNLDDVSKKNRPYKQMIERLNRTYKYHTQSQNGFSNFKGAMTKLVLFVTYYNFIRPHSSLGYRPPVEIPELSGIQFIQHKWLKIISLAA